MNKEMTWVEAAITALENSSKLWMTAPDLVREIQRTGIRDLRSAYPQAVRSLRSALNFQSRKEKGLFARREEDCSIYFALRTRLNEPVDVKGVINTKKTHSGRLSPRVKSKTNKFTSQPPSSPHPLVNGLPHEPHHQAVPPSLLPLHPLTPTQPYTIEIDPSSKPPVNGRGSTSEGNFCLPSPLQSLLGPIRTLHLFNESAPANHTCRPVRQARMRKSLKDQENSSPDAKIINSAHDATPTPLPLPLGPPPLHEVLRLETCHPVPSLLSEVACVRYTCTNPSSCKSPGLEEDPCSVQGERKCSGRFEIKSLDAAATSSESDFDDEDDDDLTSMETLSESDSESEDQILVQPTPRAKLMMHKPLRRLSSSCAESMTADESLLLRETSQTGAVESALPPPGRQSRAYSTDLGRLQNANSSSVRASSRTDSRSLDNTMKKPSSNGFMASAALEQRRYVASLFQPASPLVGENMKLFLNMDAYRGLTHLQKSKLQALMPSVDRSSGGKLPISDSTFNNAFFGSALREWQERIALGTFTTEYKAKVRGEEKRRTTVKAEDLWKQKFYEENWGDMKEGADDDRDSFPVPYYPHTHTIPPTDRSPACLSAIMDGYHRKDKSKPNESDSSTSQNALLDNSNPSSHSHPPSTPTLAPPTTTATTALCPPPPPPSIPTQTTTSLRKNEKLVVKPTLASPKKTSRTKSTPSTNSPLVSGSANHVIKKTPVKSQSQSPRSKNLLGSLLKSNATLSITAIPTNANKKAPVGKKPAVVKRLGASMKSPQTTGKAVAKSLLRSTVHGRSSGQYLTRLPPKLPYQTLLSALEQASKENTAAGAKVVSIITRYTPPSKRHTHSVFHDHFSLLSSEHVPTEFCLPITSLTIKLSREVYTTHRRGQLVRQEHSYSKMASPELKLSLPRSKIRTKKNYECGETAMVLCSKCHSLYHTDCLSSGRTLCKSCSTS